MKRVAVPRSVDRRSKPGHRNRHRGCNCNIGCFWIAGSISIFQSVDNNPVDADVLVNSNRTHFFMSGLIKRISADSMVIDQTFGHPEYTDNPNVTVRLDRGAVFLNCYDMQAGQNASDPGSCSKVITDDQIADGLFVCAHTRMYDGEFYAGKIWLNSACGPFENEITTNEDRPG